jgi:hypothetical protein
MSEYERNGGWWDDFETNDESCSDCSQIPKHGANNDTIIVAAVHLTGDLPRTLYPSLLPIVTVPKFY